MEGEELQNGEASEGVPTEEDTVDIEEPADESELDLNAAAAAALQDASGFQAFLDWLKEYWWAIVIILGLAVLAYYLYIRKGPQQTA